MKTSLEFTNATPQMRAEMILDGFEHLAASARGLHANLQVFNNWLENVPMLMHDGGCSELDQKSVGKPAKVFGNNIDDLTEELVRHAEVIKKLSQYLKTKNL